MTQLYSYAVPPLLPPDAAFTTVSSIHQQISHISGLDEPVNPGDAANKEYVDSSTWKDPVKVATTGPITLSGTQTIDGIFISSGSRVLVKDQVDTSENGIYTCTTGSWSRSQDAVVTMYATGCYVYVSTGTTNMTKLFVCESTNSLFGDSIEFTEFSGGGGGVVPGGPTNAVQFNDSGTFGGSNNLLWDGSSILTVNGTITGLSDPTNSSDAANKHYVDSHSSSAAAPDGSVQFNSNNAFTGSSNFTWSSTSNLLSASNILTSGTVTSNFISANTVNINATGDSTSTTSGTLIISGGVGIGGSVYAGGSMFSQGFYTTSDIRLKEHIEQITTNIADPLDVVNGIDCYRYKLKGSEKLHYGVIAQEIEENKFLSNIIDEDPNKNKTVNYIELIPLLIESIKQLDNKITNLQN